MSYNLQELDHEVKTIQFFSEKAFRFEQEKT